jgi:hypothetical protein
VLGSVDAAQAHAMRYAVRVPHRQRIAIGHRDDMHVQAMRCGLSDRRERTRGGDEYK